MAPRSLLVAVLLIGCAAYAAAGRDILQSGSSYDCWYEGVRTSHSRWYQGPTQNCQCWYGDWRSCEPVEPEYPEPKRTCELGFAFDPKTGYCVKYQTQSPYLDCPHGFTLKVIGTEKVCISHDEKDAEYKCPHGFELKLFGGKYTCTKLVYEEAYPECPWGYKLNDKRQCVKVEEKDAIPVCAKGFELRQDGHDWEAQCFRSLRKEPEYECPKGFYLSNGKCLKW